MNPPSTSTQSSPDWQRPNDFLPLWRPGSETPVSPRRKSRDPNWWNNPSPARESFEDLFKAEKEGNDLKANATTMAPAPFIEEDDAPNPAEEALSIDSSSSNTQCDQAPKKLTNVPIASVTVTSAGETDEQEENTVARKYVPSSPTRNNWKPDEFLPLPRPASPVRKSRQAAKETSVVDIDDSKAKIDEQVETSVVRKVEPIILKRPDDFLPLRRPPASPKRNSRQAAKAKETSVVDTDEYHAEIKGEVEAVLARSVATDIDDSVTTSSSKADDFRPLRRPSNAASSASPSYEHRDSKPQTEKAPKERASLPVEIQINCSDTEAIDFGVDEEVEHTLRSKAVFAEELVERGNPAVKLHSAIPSLGHTSVEWEKPGWASEQRLKETGKAHVLKSEGNLAKPVTFPVGKGDGVNKEAQPEAVLKNKGVTPTEKNIEWEKPDWTKSHALKATGKADVLKSEGNLARPISLPVGSNNDTRTQTEKNIEWEKPDWTKCPGALKATGKADVLKSEGNLARPISLPVGSNNDAGTRDPNRDEHRLGKTRLDQVPSFKDD